MKTHILCFGLAVAAVSSAQTQYHHIDIISGENQLHQVNVDRVDKIDYLNENPSQDGCSHIRINYLNGNQIQLPLSDIRSMEWKEGRPDNPLEVTLHPHHYGLTLDIVPAEEDIWYRVIGMPEYRLEEAHIPVANWAEELIAADFYYLESAAEAWGRPLSSIPMETIFDQGTLTRDWFPDESISDHTPIALCLYTAERDGETFAVTTEPQLIRFTTKELTDLGTRWQLSADMTSTKITIKADAIDDGTSDPGIPFFIEMYSPEQVEQQTLPQLVANSLRMLEYSVYMQGLSWDDVLFHNHGERTYTNMRAGDDWIAVAYGVEYGVRTTDFSYTTFTIPEASVTDDCTFDIQLTQISNSEATLCITPSSPDTRYTAMLLETEKLEGLTPELYAANKVYYLNYMHTLDWTDTEYVHTGASLLNTQSDLIDGKYMQPGKDYTILVFGVADDGERTTALHRIDFTPEEIEVGETTFEITFTDFDPSLDWFHYVTVNVTPSDPDAKYVCDNLSVQNAYADLDNCTDEEFMQRYADSYGTYLTLYQGDHSFRKAFASEYSAEDEGYVFGDHLIFIYGYDGKPTTPLYAFRFNSATGEVTRVR